MDRAEEAGGSVRHGLEKFTVNLYSMVLTLWIICSVAHSWTEYAPSLFTSRRSSKLLWDSLHFSRQP